MTSPSKYAFLAYFLVSATDVWFAGSGHHDLRYFSKALLMPLLAVGYVLSVPRPLDRFSRLLLAGLAFSWLGDVLLMFNDPAGIYFIGGLLSFLTTHILYIRYFLLTRSASDSFFRKRPLLFLAVLAYTIELLYVLWPTLGPMKLPVAIYASVISLMLAMALWQYGKLSSITAWLFILGAMFFVASDSMLAVDKFKQPFPAAPVMVMSTYILAQWLIVRGSLRHLKPVV
jgi:uncharacterized membrane protein YhhN